jgi:HD-GYP domain-containing protein (c-di-GMP phosphodiesterase class II)
MNCTPAETETIRIAALLHDIGKVGLPPEVTTVEPEALPDHLKRIYHSHAVRGQFLLGHIDWLHDVGVLIRHHHEQMNGSGAPDRLIGAEIPLGARLIAIADYIDRTTCHAKYGTMLHTTFKKMRILVGRNFDKELIGHFEEIAPPILERPGIKIEQKEIIPLSELVPGTLMGEDLYTGSRILLVERGENISSDKVEQIRRALDMDPPACTTVLVSKA